MNITEVLDSWINKIDIELKNSEIDWSSSGSTWCLALIKNKTVYFCNTGDSRALLFSFKDPLDTTSQKFKIKDASSDLLNLSKDGLISIESTTDHTCKDDREHRRILQYGGRVERLAGDIGPLRVWLRNENSPGLAMTRSLGDFIAKSIGVISTPDIQSFELVNKYYVIVIGSDGLFEFLNSTEIAEIVWGNKHQVIL